MSLNGSMSIMEYWNDSKYTLEDLRGWSKQTVSGGSTLENYDRNMTKMAALCPEILKHTPISEVTFPQVLQVLDEVRFSRPGKPYSDSSVQNYLSVLGDIFRYAESLGDCVNVLNRYSFPRRRQKNGKPEKLDSLLSTALNVALTPEKREAAISEILERRKIRKSLTPDELLRLVHQILALLDSDGRALGIALILWLGVRPSECLGLRWEDIHRFPGNDGCYIEVCRKLTASGISTNELKSKNAYRRIPIHEELAEILELRRDYIRRVTGKEPEGYICCVGNSFGELCRYAMLAQFAKEKVFPFLNEDILMDCALLMALDDITQSQNTDEQDTLTLYVLRRNFWTWLQSGSQLTLMERRYVMGHDMDALMPGLREQYNDLDRLWEIACKWNRVFFSRELPHRHLEVQTLVMDKNGVSAVGLPTGVQSIVIPAESLGDGCVLEGTVLCTESGDSIDFELASAARSMYGVRLEIVSTPIPNQSSDFGPLNMEQGLHRAMNLARLRQSKNSQS